MIITTIIWIKYLGVFSVIYGIIINQGQNGIMNIIFKWQMKINYPFIMVLEFMETNLGINDLIISLFLSVICCIFYYSKR